MMNLRLVDREGVEVATTTADLDEQRTIRSETQETAALRACMQNIFEAVEAPRAGGTGLETVNGFSRCQNILKIQH